MCAAAVAAATATVAITTVFGFGRCLIVVILRIGRKGVVFASTGISSALHTVQYST
jgi:hypothetical protein